MRVYKNFFFALGSYTDFDVGRHCSMVYDMDNPTQSPVKLPELTSMYKNVRKTTNNNKNITGYIEMDVSCFVTYSNLESGDILLCVGGRNNPDAFKYLPLEQNSDGSWREWVLVKKDKVDIHVTFSNKEHFSSPTTCPCQSPGSTSLILEPHLQ